ncbi:MAG: HEAT repeat domain-containing protein [Promethearchaeota archaeon]
MLSSQFDEETEEAIEQHLKDVESEKEHVRKDAIAALRRIGRPAIKPLIALLKHERADVRKRAAKALGRLHDTQALEPLLDVLQKDEEEIVRSRAAWALGELRDRMAVDALIIALEEDEDSVRVKAAEALGALRDPKGVDVLIGGLESIDWTLRLMSAWSLGMIGDPRALKPLKKALKVEENESVQEALEEALAEFKGR